MSEVRVALTLYPRTDDSMSNFLQKLLRAVDDDLGRAWSWTWLAGWHVGSDGCCKMRRHQAIG